MSVATPFDFTRSRSLGSRLQARVLTWMDFFCKNPSRLERSLGLVPMLETKPITTGVFSELAAAWAEPAVGCRVQFGLDDVSSLLVIPGRMARALVSQMLGAPVAADETPDGDAEPPRELTRVEQAMIEMFVGDVCAALVEAWPDADPPQVVAGSLEANAARSKFVAKTAELISVSLSLTVDEVTSKIEWLLPPDAFSGFEEAAAAIPTPASRQNLETLVRSAPVEVVVELGEARMFLRDLAHLKAGDLIVLDKKLGHPLSASIDERSRFVGWPGRIGSQQAYQIEELTSGDRTGGTV